MYDRSIFRIFTYFVLSVCFIPTKHFLQIIDCSTIIFYCMSLYNNYKG